MEYAGINSFGTVGCSLFIAFILLLIVFFIIFLPTTALYYFFFRQDSNEQVADAKKEIDESDFEGW